MPLSYLPYWLSAFTFVQSVFSQVSSQPLDITRSGNYVLRNCGAGVPNGYAGKLQTMLPEIYQNLQGVIADAALGTSSSSVVITQLFK